MFSFVCRIESAVQSSIFIQPGDESLFRISFCSADHDLAARCQGHAIDGRVCSKSLLEAAVQSSIGIEPADPDAGWLAGGREFSSDQDFAVLLNENRYDRTVWPVARVKQIVHLSVVVQARDQISIDAVKGGEISSDQHLAIRLRGNGPDTSVKETTFPTCSRIERHVEAAVRIQSSDTDPFDIIDFGKTASGQHLASGWQRNGEDRAICAGARIES